MAAKLNLLSQQEVDFEHEAEVSVHDVHMADIVNPWVLKIALWLCRMLMLLLP